MKGGLADVHLCVSEEKNQKNLTTSVFPKVSDLDRLYIFFQKPVSATPFLFSALRSFMCDVFDQFVFILRESNTYCVNTLPRSILLECQLNFVTSIPV